MQEQGSAFSYREKKVKRKIIVSMMVASLIACYTPVSTASTMSDLKKENQKVQQEKTELSGSINELQAQIDAETQSLAVLESTIAENEANYAAAEEDLKETKTDIKQRQDGLDDRLRVIYKRGSIGYLDVLLGSNSLDELITNVDMVSKIYHNDEEVLKELNIEKSNLEKKEKELKQQRAELDGQKSELVARTESLAVSQAKLQEEYKALEEQENNLKAAMSAEAERIAEEKRKAEEARRAAEAKRKAEEEAARQAAEAAAAVASEPAESAPAPSAPKTSGKSSSGYLWPSDCTIVTSLKGYRNVPGGSSDHGGIDIGASNGSSIYATKSGVVTMASWNGGYGLCVVISHGGGMFSLYAHCSSLLVSNGEYVDQGQTIARVGGTGGYVPHLHFEIHNGYGNRIDPLTKFSSSSYSLTYDAIHRI